MAKPDSKHITRFPGDRPPAPAINAVPDPPPAPADAEPAEPPAGASPGFQIAVVLWAAGFLLLFVQILLDLILGLFHP
jgi:hypothetical protein